MFCEQPSHDSFTISSASFEEPWEHYKATIFSDGTTVLIIENGTFVSRTFKIENSADTFLEILQLLDSYQFTLFSDSYGVNMEGVDPQCKKKVPHKPFSILSFQYAGQHKTVRVDHGCKGFERENELNTLSKRIKNKMGLMDYVGT
ncbi:hypothetical protein [Alteromonas sp. C1M14]|uniref:hypothetical protein n=1 Tax=Alteromonas sp. C1M14 TaxID=2841567 RepID=UPI001C098AE2|nr:hypothetical protein [Alteromonas sp. C1M14]MBU2977503.1 hypothetical protein [Alteromonas sp. C1M14]